MAWFSIAVAAYEDLANSVVRCFPSGTMYVLSTSTRRRSVSAGAIAIRCSVSLSHPTPTPLTLWAVWIMVGFFPLVLSRGNVSSTFATSSCVPMKPECWRIVNFPKLFLPFIWVKSRSYSTNHFGSFSRSCVVRIVCWTVMSSAIPRRVISGKRIARGRRTSMHTVIQNLSMDHSPPWTSPPGRSNHRSLPSTDVSTLPSCAL